MINWIGMRADTKQARHKKAKEIRLMPPLFGGSRKTGVE